MGDEPHVRHPTPNEIVDELLDGNRRFRDGVRRERDLPAEVRATGDHQHPTMAIVGCIDSRVAPELVFDLGIGEAFDIRLAGAMVDDAALGSLEYACGVAGAGYLLVLGHTGCGAVKAACDIASDGGAAGKDLGNIQAVIAPILETIATETTTTGGRDSSNLEFVDRVAELNVHRTILEIRRRSILLETLIGDGALAIAGAMYDVRSGAVRMLD